ncbi:hypothetical protein CROQUDRAFT_133267 [Cronartium quercuum f. sp. fusiforme G11]|uniref:Mitochondrial inner membrane protease subunit 2 n=1 Tax=Cronartium quercuum f. sp. fusiforme G11 TaxID=708437 RepID=A0A9P6NIF6_9BASI|nr:hypothetical protein CROQUDRAFT_133267 [Cronartium quercuum f. sp. fusiforme G11]
MDRGYSFVRINGMSMQPTLNPDSSCLKRDLVILNRFTDKFKRGDVVTVYHPVHPTLTLTKRIIGLEGDIYSHSDRFVRIPPGHCWVEGDESFHSQDSNTFGPIPVGLISGRVDLIVYPFSRFGTISHTLQNSQNKRVLARKFT